MFETKAPLCPRSQVSDPWSSMIQTCNRPLRLQCSLGLPVDKSEKHSPIFEPKKKAILPHCTPSHPPGPHSCHPLPAP